MENFKGYKKSFLGTKFNVSLPKPDKSNLRDIAPVINKKDNLLLYPNYTVLQSASRRFPIFSASNIDGKSFQSIGRKALFPGGKDKWAKDPRLSKEHQWGDELYAAPKSDFDKGHLTKREDVQWGKTVPEATLAAKKTFFFTNAVPQRKELNQQIWRSLEDYILKTETVKNGLKINVITGPVLNNSDPLFVNTIKGQDVKIPILFWKIVYFVKSNGELNRVGFLMGQKSLLEKSGLLRKVRQVGAGAARAKADPLFTKFSAAGTYQVEISTIEALTKMKFHPAKDPFKDKRAIKLVLQETDLKRSGASRPGTAAPVSIKGIVL